jgi:predicted TIM-barrel fold metal-dependent hydrolase
VTLRPEQLSVHRSSFVSGVPAADLSVLYWSVRSGVVAGCEETIVKNGMRIIDTDTHVGPNVETLQQYASPTLLERWDELTKYHMAITDGGHHLSINPIPYRRKFGLRIEQESAVAGGANPLKGNVSKQLHVPASPNINNDNAPGRLADMDREGVDVHLIIPATFANAISALELPLAKEIWEAYHRFIGTYCSHDPQRLKATIFVTGADPEWSVATITSLQDEPWVASVTVVLPDGIPVDDERLDPIWTAMGDADLPLLHHSFFYEPPYFPGYRDVWDNIVIARSAAHPWGAERLVGYLILSGLFDRFPRLRVGFAECSAGWLPGWLVRLQGQAAYMSHAVPSLSKTPVEYAHDGRIFCGIELYEGEAMADAIVRVCGDGVLMYQSDFPHPGSEYPSSPEVVMGWTGLGQETIGRILGGNAERFLRM